MKNNHVDEMIKSHTATVTAYAMREVKIALAMIQNVVNKEREIEKGNLLANTMSYDITTLIPLLGETINSFFNVENTTLSISDIKVTNEMELYENFTSVEDISFNIYVTIAKSMVNPYTFTIYFSGNLEETVLADRICTAYNVWYNHGRHTLQNEELMIQLYNFVQREYRGKNLLIGSSSIRCGISPQKEVFIEIDNINFNQFEGKINVYTGKLHVEVKEFLHSDITKLLENDNDITDSYAVLLPSASLVTSGKVLEVINALPKTYFVNGTECVRIIEKIDIVDFTGSVLKVGVTFLGLNERVSLPVGKEEFIVEFDIDVPTYTVEYVTNYKKIE